MATDLTDPELELIGLYDDQDEATIWARRVAWANEGRTPDDVDNWTSTREGDFFHVASFPGVREDARIYSLMGTEVVGAAHPLFAWETYLEAHAAVQNIEREAAVAATGQVTFTGTDGKVIPAGARVGVEPIDPDAEAPEYETTVAGTIAGGTVTVAVRAVIAGEAGNVSAGAVNSILNPQAGWTSVTNADAIVGGEDTETDDSLRARLIARYGSGGSGWNQEAYRVASLSYGGGIGRVTVIPLWNGPGTVKVIIATKEGEPVAADTVTGLQAFLDPIVGQGAGAVTAGAQVTVQTVATLNVTIGGTLEFDAGYSLDGDGGTIETRPLIEARLASYVNAVESGDEVVVARVVAQLAVKGVHDIGSVTINGVAANLAVPAGASPKAPALVTPTALIEGSVP